MIPIYKPYLPSRSLQYAHEAIDSTRLSSQGKFLPLVTEKLQELLNVKHVLPLNNGTSACHLVAKCAADKKNLHEVIVPNNVYVAAWNAFLFDSNWDLFSVECDLNTWNYDMEELHKAILDHPNAAVLIVHNVGNIINVPSLQARYPRTTFLEDNCEGFLGKYDGKQTGTASYASAISFFGNKNITCGEGGAFVTNDESAYLYAKMVQAQGQSSKRFVHNDLGYNYRMTNIQAALLYGQLEVLPDIMQMKHDVFNRYRANLSGRTDVLMQESDPNTEHANWMFGIRVPSNPNYETAELYFKAEGIEIRPMFYPITSHAYLNKMSYVNISDCKKAEILNKECFVLPSYPELALGDQLRVLYTLEDYLRNK